MAFPQGQLMTPPCQRPGPHGRTRLGTAPVDFRRAALTPSPKKEKWRNSSVRAYPATRPPARPPHQRPTANTSAPHKRATAAGPRLLIRQVQHLLISQLTSISGGSSPIRHLGTRLVACSSAPTERQYVSIKLKFYIKVCRGFVLVYHIWPLSLFGRPAGFAKTWRRFRFLVNAISFLATGCTRPRLIRMVASCNYFSPEAQIATN